jgi:hypothetical protein
MAMTSVSAIFCCFFFSLFCQTAITISNGTLAWTENRTGHDFTVAYGIF